jgi:hypothetical protein
MKILKQVEKTGVKEEEVKEKEICSSWTRCYLVAPDKN